MAKRILICDDEADILQVTQIILESDGYEVFTTQEVDDPIALVLEHQPNVILMDLWIPKVGGIDAVKMLKKDNRTKDIPVLLFSANNETASISNEIGANGFISKPFDVEQLKSTMKELFG